MIQLRLGCSGNEVRQLQNLLNHHLRPSHTIRVDGIFGPQTEAAVRQFQTSAGLSTDGVVGIQTWKALDQGITLTSETGLASANAHDASWIKIAAAEIGQKEIPRTSANPRILLYHSTTSLRATSDEVAWCSAFVNWCLRQVGIAGTDSAAATSWLHWGLISAPRLGAISVVRKVTGENHVAFYISETSDYYKLLGGNQGDQVRISKYYKSHWLTQGHRWPNQQQ
ncbi:TIGR02594 family protein [Geomonas nitrogeniifigens]|uniref:TIGR02594 family protein n=1 Tax=Geomonas diazotrophica TaxID=2843197 RepID=A0ABX8JM36_9BACT|nr:TIGR02594 family protein [Geomonas nitrogeniifigens]QWV98221.1 TIGR02594 family protein [Geomonas nitrogeniifigens]